MDNKIRIELVSNLVNLSGSVDNTLEQLFLYGWDFDGAPYLLKPENLLAVIQKFMNGEISSAELEKWANAVECREDIKYCDNQVKDTIGSIIHRLANPILMGDINVILCRDFLNLLKLN